MKNISKFFLTLAIVLMTCSFVAAEQYVSANDMEPASITRAKVIDGFTFNASSDKAITVENIDIPRISEDGEVFTVRIKLNGSGTTSFRSVSFNAKAGQKLTVYLTSSSGSEDRILVIANGAGESVAKLVAPADVVTSEGKAGIQTFKIPADGTYYLYSAKSGVNLYQIIIE